MVHQTFQIYNKKGIGNSRFLSNFKAWTSHGFSSKIQKGVL